MKKRYLLILFPLIGLIWYGFYIARLEIKLLKECSSEHKAVIVDKYKTRKKGNTFKYEYNIGGEYYATSESVTDSIYDIFNLGDTIFIQYACSDNNISKIQKRWI